MSHVRQQIRDRVQMVLTGLTTTGSNVFLSRVYPLQKNELPCLLIYTIAETSKPLEPSTASRAINRVLDLNIEAVLDGINGYDDTLDTIAKEVETAMSNDTDLNGLVMDQYLIESKIKYTGGEGEKPLAALSLVYRVQYMNQENDPETAM